MTHQHLLSGKKLQRTFCYRLYKYLKYTHLRDQYSFVDCVSLSMTATPKPLSIVAKCALCSTKTELFVCPHCDEVICQICVNKHRSVLNETLKEHWIKCQVKFQNLSQLSSKNFLSTIDLIISR